MGPGTPERRLHLDVIRWNSWALNKMDRVKHFRDWTSVQSPDARQLFGRSWARCLPFTSEVVLKIYPLRKLTGPPGPEYKGGKDGHRAHSLDQHALLAWLLAEIKASWNSYGQARLSLEMSGAPMGWTLDLRAGDRPYLHTLYSDAGKEDTKAWHQEDGRIRVE